MGPRSYSDIWIFVNTKGIARLRTSNEIKLKPGLEWLGTKPGLQRQALLRAIKWGYLKLLNEQSARPKTEAA